MLEKVSFVLYNENGDSMNKEIIKATNIEYIENMYALAINSFVKSNNMELKKLIDELVFFEDKIREEDNEKELNNYIISLNELINKIEVLINE